MLLFEVPRQVPLGRVRFGAPSLVTCKSSDGAGTWTGHGSHVFETIFMNYNQLTMHLFLIRLIMKTAAAEQVQFMHHV